MASYTDWAAQTPAQQGDVGTAPSRSSRQGNSFYDFGAWLRESLFGGGQGRDPFQEAADEMARGREGGMPVVLPGGLAEANLTDPLITQRWLNELPEEMRNAVIMNLQQNDAINKINQQRFMEWQNLMRGAYGEAMGGLGQMRGIYA